MGILFLLGTLTGLERNYYPILGIIILVIIGVSNFRHHDKKRAIVISLVLALIFLMAILKAYQKDVVYHSQRDYLEKKAEIKVSGRIYKKEYKNERIRLYLKDVRSKDGALFPALVFGKEDIEIGSFVEVSGRVMEISVPDNEGEFDYGKYLKSQELVGNLEIKDIRVIKEPKVSFMEFLFDLRERIKDFYEENLPGEESGLLSSIALGDKTELDKEASDLFRKAGLSHILAISGLHLSIVGSLIYELLRRRGVSFLGAGIVSSVIVLLYGLFAGTPVSMVRALSMFLIVLVGNILGRAADMLNSLSIVALGFLIYNPFIIYNTGFALSFLIILGICLVSASMSEYYRKECKERWERKYKDEVMDFEMTLGEKVISALVSGFSIWAFSVPILAIYFNEVPVYVIVLNLMVLPVLGVLLVMGLLSGFLGISVGLVPCHYILYYYEAVAYFFTKLPGSTIVIAKPGVWGLVFYYGVLLGVVRLITQGFGVLDGRLIKLLARRVKELLVRRLDMLLIRWSRNPSSQTFGERGPQILRTGFEGTTGYKKHQTTGQGDHQTTGYKDHQTTGRNLILFFILTIFLTFSLKIASYPLGFRIDMLSVGQGDGIYFQSPDNVTFFVDGGSSSEKNVGEYTILPYLKYNGVSHIDYWILTHLDDDHISGFLELLEKGYKIDNLILSKSVEGGEVLDYILNLCRKNKTRVNYVVPGNYIETKNLRIDFLYPNYPPNRDGANENSLVFLLSYGDYNGIFTGDMGVKEEEDLLNSKLFQSLMRDVDVELLKVAHHGSKNSSESEWLTFLSPDIAIISAGKNNRYHHPSNETLKRLEKAHIPYITTIESGRIRITTKGVYLYI